MELFFNTDGYRAIKVNTPRNLSGFYLPNSSYGFPAIVLAPQGPGTSQYPNTAIFRPAGTAPFVQFPYTGGNAGTFGIVAPVNAGTVFGFPGGFALLGPPTNTGNNGAANFPGVGSVFGSVLPGVVLQTVVLTDQAGNPSGQIPTVFTTQPTYLPDAPLLNRTYGESAFSTFTVGGKWRFTGTDNPVGIGIIPFYRFYADSADELSGFNQLQRGASPGGNRGDFGVIGFADARLRKWLSIEANIGYIYNSSIKSGDTTLLDRPDEVLAGIGVDFPVNKYFQPILEFRSNWYVGGRTPNAFENNPIEGLAGARIFPFRWMSLGGWYRHHFNPQDRGSLEDANFNGQVAVTGLNTTVNNSFSGVPPGFRPSTDPHGFGFQITAGRRNARAPLQKENGFADVTDVGLSDTVIKVPCPQGTRPKEGTECSDNQSINVNTTAVDPENDVLTYNYTVSGGRVVGSGANVSWDLSGVSPGTYTITAGVDDGCGICGKTITKNITVEECECETICTCPSGLTVTGPSALTTAGNTMVFTANVAPGSGNTTYNWSVDAGEIISGQGTPSITVSTTTDMAGSNVNARVEVGMDPSNCNCSLSDSETGVIAEPPKSVKVDEFNKAVNDEVKARIQNFYETYLNSNPDNHGYIINYGTPREVARREKQISDAIRFLRFDPSRVTMVNGGDRGNGIETTFWIVPPGAENPTP
ncbi:MAG: hypothetical protein R2747_07005 [Pyrinomonadaceae bacterium]